MRLNAFAGPALAVMMGMLPGALAAQVVEPPQIRVSGEGRVEVAPDMATLMLGATAEAETAADAMSQTSEQVRAVLERLTAAGIEERDIQTSGLMLSPRWHHPENHQESPRITGYIAQNTLNVRVRDLDILGDLLDDVVQDGANTFQGLSFGLNEPEPQKDEARRRAVADARRKAELYAEAAGVALGDVIAIAEPEQFGPPMPMYRMEAAMDSGVPVAAGELTLDANVTVVFAIARE